MGRNTFETVRRAELLARLELLDGMIDQEASRAELVREMGWDAARYEQRSKVLKATRQHYVALLRQLLLDMEASDADGGAAPATLRSDEQLSPPLDACDARRADAP